MSIFKYLIPSPFLPFAVGVSLALSACGNTLEQRAGSGAAFGAGAGAAVGAVASPAIVGSAMVGAIVGTTAGIAVHETSADTAGRPSGVALRQILQEQARMWDVSDPILSEGAGLCRERVRASFGFVAWTRWDIDRSYRIASMGEFGLDDRLRVVHVVPGSPAATAGLRAGDEIEAIGRHEIPAGPSAGPALGLILEREARIGMAESFRVRRGEQREAVEIVPRAQCDFDLVVTESAQINGFVRGRTIYVTDGLMRYLADDADLAAISAHLLGHALFHHRAETDEVPAMEKLSDQAESLVTATLDPEGWNERRKSGDLPGILPYSEIQEIQADRAALELLARAGYPLEALADVWDRLADMQGDGILLDDFHPPSEARRAALRDLLKQVRNQEDLGSPSSGS